MTGSARKKDRRPHSGEVRVIGGMWRSRRIGFPSLEGLRPTPDRVRETLFNWLGQHIDGFRCLDLYAGSGALGFEALSRGASQVVMVEREPSAFVALGKNAQVLGAVGLELVRGDALEFAARLNATAARSEPRCVSPRFDVIFLDPPFGMGISSGLLALLPALLAKGGRAYVESGQVVNPPAPWVVERRGRAGQVHFQLMRLETT